MYSVLPYFVVVPGLHLQSLRTFIRLCLGPGPPAGPGRRLCAKGRSAASCSTTPQFCSRRTNLALGAFCNQGTDGPWFRYHHNARTGRRPRLHSLHRLHRPPRPPLPPRPYLPSSLPSPSLSPPPPPLPLPIDGTVTVMEFASASLPLPSSAAACWSRREWCRRSCWGRSQTPTLLVSATGPRRRRTTRTPRTEYTARPPGPGGHRGGRSRCPPPRPCHQERASARRGHMGKLVGAAAAGVARVLIDG